METRFDSVAPLEQLRVYPVVQQLAVRVHRAMERVPRGHAALKDQVRRAAQSVVCNVAEGAGRYAPADKRARYRVAIGELTECLACLDTAVRLDLIDRAERASLGQMAARASRMLHGLVRAMGLRIQRE